MGPINLVPTLFKLEEKTITIQSTCVKANLTRIYDDNIKNKYMKKGNIYNALLPYFDNKSGSTHFDNEMSYEYKGANDIVFTMLKKPNNRMLFLKLVEVGNEASVYTQNCFAKVTFLSKTDSEYHKEKKKGIVEFYLNTEDYNGLNALENGKYLLLEDRMNEQLYAFECWIEQLPEPGKDEGVYVYTDGSAGGKNPEEYGSGYVLNIGKNVYLGHTKGKDTGRNVSAEYEAVTNVFLHMPKEVENTEEVTIYYDNNNVGYIAVGIYKAGTSYSQKYVKVLEEYLKNHPETKLTFVHTDGHSDIYGNEMADQVAQRKEEYLKKLVAGFAEKRAILCPEDGRFSEPLKFVE